MLRTLGWALQSSCKMMLIFIFGNKCNFFFSHSVTLVLWYLGASVKKSASHQFPGNIFVIEEGLARWSWQPSPGLDFPPWVCSVAARWLEAAPTSWWPSSPGRHPAVSASLALLVVQVTRNGFRNPAGRALGGFALYPTWTLAFASGFAQL